MKIDVLKNGKKVGEAFVDEPIIETHNRKPSPAQFIGLFSDDAWDTIRNHPSKKLKKWVDQIMTMGAVDLDDDIVTSGVAALESNGVINSTEAGIVLAGVEL